MLAGKTVMVTGGTGFVGGRLVEKLILEQGAQVRALVRNYSSASRLGRFQLDMIYGDITDADAVREAVKGCDYIFHCAHESSLSKNKQKHMATQGTRNVCEAALEFGVSQMVHVSTYAVHEPTGDGYLTETSPWPESEHPYTLAKRAAEELVLDMHRQSGLPAVVLQPTMIYGPYCNPWTIKPVQDLQSGLVPLVDGGEGYANAVYIDDVVDAMFLAAIAAEARGEVFLISDVHPITWKTFYGAFEDILGIKATVDVPAEKLAALEAARLEKETTKAQLMGLARHPQVVSRVLRASPVQLSAKLLKNVLSDDQRRALRMRVKPNGANRSGKPSSNGTTKSIHVPNETLLAYYKPQTHVRIDKAQQMLGYTPKFDFDKGMALTAQYLRWANLI